MHKEWHVNGNLKVELNAADSLVDNGAAKRVFGAKYSTNGPGDLLTSWESMQYHGQFPLGDKSSCIHTDDCYQTVRWNRLILLGGYGSQMLVLFRKITIPVYQHHSNQLTFHLAMVIPRVTPLLGLKWCKPVTIARAVVIWVSWFYHYIKTVVS